MPDIVHNTLYKLQMIIFFPPEVVPLLGTRQIEQGMISNIQLGTDLSQAWVASLESAQLPLVGLCSYGLSPRDFQLKSQCIHQCLSSCWILNSDLGLCNMETLPKIPISFSGAVCLVQNLADTSRRKLSMSFPKFCWFL